MIWKRNFIKTPEDNWVTIQQKILKLYPRPFCDHCVWPISDLCWRVKKHLKQHRCLIDFGYLCHFLSHVHCGSAGSQGWVWWWGTTQREGRLWHGHDCDLKKKQIHKPNSQIRNVLLNHYLCLFWTLKLMSFPKTDSTLCAILKFNLLLMMLI